MTSNASNRLDMEWTGHAIMLWSEGSSISKRRVPKTYMLVFVSVTELVQGHGTELLVLGSPLHRGGWRNGREKTCTAQPAAVACTQLSPNKPADCGLSFPFSLKVIQRKDVSENWFPCTGKRRGNLHRKPARDEHRDEKQNPDGFPSRFLVLYKLSSPDRTPLYLRTFSPVKMDEGSFYNPTMLVFHIWLLFSFTCLWYPMTVHKIPSAFPPN